MSYDDELQISYVKWLDAITVLVTFGLLWALTLNSNDTVSLLGVRASLSLPAMAAHGVGLSIALLALVGWAGMLFGKWDDYHIAEAAHKGLYYLHIALLAVIGVAGVCAVCQGGDAAWGYLWIGVVAAMATLLWRSAFLLVRSVRQDLDELITY